MFTNLPKGFGDGNIENFMDTVPCFCLINPKTDKIVKKCKSLSYPSPVRATMNFDSIGIPLFSRELWELEPIPGKKMAYRIRAATDKSVFLFCDENKKKGDQFFVASFKSNKNTNERIYYYDGKNINPTVFKLTYVGSGIAFQVERSKKWICLKSDDLFLQDNFTDSCEFRIGCKLSLYSYVPSIVSFRSYLTVTSPLRGYKVVFQNIWPDKSTALLLIPRGSYFIIKTARGNYLAVKNDQIATSPLPNLPQNHFRLEFKDDGGCNIFAKDSTDKFSMLCTDNNRNPLSFKEKLSNKVSGKASTLYFTFLPEKTFSAVPLVDTVEEEEAIDVSDVIPKNPIFGTPIPQILAREGTEVPLVVQNCVQYLRKYVDSEGLFRLSGSKRVIDSVKRELDLGVKLPQIIQNNKEVNQDVISGTLKQYISESKLLPNEIINLLTNVVYNFNELMDDPNVETVTAVSGPNSFTYPKVYQENLRSVVQNQLPNYIRNTFGYLCKFFNELIKHSDLNKMILQNVTLVIVPNLHSDVFGNAALTIIFQIFVADYYSIFE